MGKKNKKCERDDGYAKYVVGGTGTECLFDMLECHSEEVAVEEAKIRVKENQEPMLIYKLVKIVTQAEPVVEDVS